MLGRAQPAEVRGMRMDQQDSLGGKGAGDHPEAGFGRLDAQRFSAFHRQALITTGMGCVTDGYDLTSIGIVLPLVLASFDAKQSGGFAAAMLAGAALLGAALGALIFGQLAQHGRKRFYGLDALIMAIAGVAQAAAPDLACLIAIRFVLGLGVGADYVLSPIIMAEHANRADRGRALGLGFSMLYWAGAVMAALVSLLLHALGVAPGLIWRIVLATGALPAIAVLYLRRRMPETARYLARMAGDEAGARAVVESITGTPGMVPPVDGRDFGSVFRRHARDIFAASLLWFTFDIVLYATVLFGPSLIAKGLGLTPMLFSLIITLVFIMPALMVGSLCFLDRFGRKPVMIFGYSGAAIVLCLFNVLHPVIIHHAILGLFIYGVFNAMLMGPGLVCGVALLGVELTPTRIRAVGQSITVVGGRIGATVSAFVFPLMFAKLGQSAAIGTLAVLSIIGAIMTKRLIPETAGRSLEDVNDEPAGRET
jgi:MFS family permease